MARLLENDSLELIGRYGVPVPAFEVVSSAEEATGALERLGGKAVLKALVPVGKRGKAGAVKFVTSPEEARAEGGRILGAKVGFFPVNRLLVMETLDIKREFFLSITFDLTCPPHIGPCRMRGFSVLFRHDRLIRGDFSCRGSVIRLSRLSAS